MSLGPQDLERTLTLLQDPEFARALVEGSNRRQLDPDAPPPAYTGSPENYGLIKYLLGYQDTPYPSYPPVPRRMTSQEPVENANLFNYLLGYRPGSDGVYHRPEVYHSYNPNRRPVGLLDHPILGSFFQKPTDDDGPRIPPSPFYHPDEVIDNYVPILYAAA